MRGTGVCEKDTSFLRAFAPQHRGINSSPAPDLMFFKLINPRVSLSGGVFFHRHRHEEERGRHSEGTGRDRKGEGSVPPQSLPCSSGVACQPSFCLQLFIGGQHSCGDNHAARLTTNWQTTQSPARIKQPNQPKQSGYVNLTQKQVMQIS